MTQTARTIFALLFLLTGCATAPADPVELAEFKALNDPLEPMNRKILEFNNAADKYVLHPIATGYRSVTTPDFRKGVRAFIANLKTPLSMANNVLQFNLANAGKDLSRFVINSTLGVFGVFDIATRMGLEANPQGFGTTMAVWGVPDGPYLILPLLGPSNVRDAAGMGANYLLDPATYIAWNSSKPSVKDTTLTLDIVEPLAVYENAMDLLDDARSTALDYYAYVRTMYRQHRQKAIDDAKGASVESAPSYEFDLDDEE